MNRTPVIADRGFLVAVLLSFFSLLSSSNALASPVNLQQADGSVLQLEQAAQSLITLSPHLTELVFAAGAGDRIIATVEYSNYPAEAEQLPRVGDAFRVDLERIISLKPDLVIAWQSGNPMLAIARLEELGIAVWVIEIRRPEEIASSLEQIGLATGNRKAANLAAEHSRQQLESIKRLGAGRKNVRYFYQVAAQPLFTLNGEHLISQSLSLCGGINVFADESILAPQIGRESVVLSNPEVMFASVIDGEANPLDVWLEWKNLQAVKQQRLYLLPADEITRASPRMLAAVAGACSLMHQNEPSSVGPSNE